MSLEDKKRLFIVCQNNSGSTVLYRLFDKCSAAKKLSTEGQLLYGPQNGPVNNAGRFNGKYFAEVSEEFENTNNYNWTNIKHLWNQDHEQHEANKEEIKVLIEKSPPNIFRAQLLQEQFKNPYFIIMVRNPFAVCEGMKRRLGFEVEKSAKFWLKCSKKQIENIEKLKYNIWFTYEDFCDNREIIRSEIVEFIPELSDLNINSKVAVHSLFDLGHKDKNIENLNNSQIRRLTKNEKENIREVLANEIETVRFFGYNLEEDNI